MPKHSELGLKQSGRRAIEGSLNVNYLGASMGVGGGGEGGGYMGRPRCHQGRLIQQMEISRTHPSYPIVCYKERL